MSGIDVEEAIARAHHEEWARVVASLARRFGDLDIAEEATAEAFAIGRRAVAGGRAYLPIPARWLTTTANRKAIDRLRREAKRDDKQQGGPDAVRRRPARADSAPSTTTGSGWSSPAATPRWRWRPA